MGKNKGNLIWCARKDGILNKLRVTCYKFNKFILCPLKIDFVLTNSANPDEIKHNAAFHLGLHCLLKYLFRGFWPTKGYL